MTLNKNATIWVTTVGFFSVVPVKVKKSKQILHFGLEMVTCMQNNEPPPQLFDPIDKYKDDDDMRQLKALITAMTAYKDNDRMPLTVVKGSVLEIYCEYFE